MEYRSEEIQTCFSGSVWVVSLGGRGAYGARPSEEECGDQITQGCNLVTADLPGNPGAASSSAHLSWRPQWVHAEEIL